jgi:hypothetical protein
MYRDTQVDGVTMHYIDVRIMGVSNGFVLSRPRTRIEIEDCIQRPDLNLVFEDVDKLCNWLKEQAKAGPNV